MRPATAARAALVALAVLGASACSASGLAFRQDDRVRFVEPADREEVEEPVKFRWRAEGLPAGTTYAVFVDRSPQPPGKTVAWLFRDDKSCARIPECPDSEYLALRGIFLTDEEELTVSRLRDLDDQSRQLHAVTVVLLDRQGRRLGESAFIREVQLRAEDN
ncbi:MAG: hypothetical protein ACLGHT_01835 [Acidimicrobiia bacterium]